MEKVKLPREVAEAIEYYKAHYDYYEQSLMKVAMEEVRYIGDPDYCDDIKEYVKSIDNLRMLMAALVNGYEVEQTPEERVKELFDLYNSQTDLGRASRDAIKAVLINLGIKIEGINA